MGMIREETVIKRLNENDRFTMARGPTDLGLNDAT